MKEKQSGELSGKYCSSLGTDVMVLSSVDESGNITRRCLSSHLCRGDDRITCVSSGYETKNKNIQNI